MQVERTVNLNLTNWILKVLSPIAIGGEACKEGTIIEVSADEARNLLHRGKAVEATEAEVTAAGASVVKSRTIDRGPDPDAWRTAATW